ncbi:UDP-glucoronosyl and UDP-glucosyl transferase, partial [Trichostrongylus colubriformis]
VTLQPVIDPSLATNGTTKSRVIQHGPFSDSSRTTRNDDMKPIWTTGAANPMSIVMFVPMIANMSVKTMTHLLDDKQLLEQLKAEKFDVAITELFDFIGIGVLEAIGLKNIVGAHSSAIVEGTASAIGAPIIPSYMPASYGVTDDSTDIWTRFTNLMFTGASWYFQTGVVSAIDRLLKEKLREKATPIWDIISNMSWVLVNTEPLLDFDRPTLHKIVHVGGLSVHKPKPLSKEWNQILNLRPRTILISFGSVAQSVLMPDLMKKTIINVIKS